MQHGSHPCFARAKHLDTSVELQGFYGAQNVCLEANIRSLPSTREKAALKPSEGDLRKFRGWDLNVRKHVELKRVVLPGNRIVLDRFPPHKHGQNPDSKRLHP